MYTKILGLAGNFMDVDETVYALEQLEVEKLRYHSQAIFIAIKYLRKFQKIQEITRGED